MNFIEFKTDESPNGLVVVPVSGIKGVIVNKDEHKTHIVIEGGGFVVNHPYDKVKQMIRKVLDKDYKMYEVHSWENQIK